MAQENIQAQQPNFCIAPLVGTFATIDTTQTTSRLLIKNTSGTTTVTYTTNPNIPQNTVIQYLEYIGPRSVTSMLNNMVFITMESNATSQVVIKKWNLNKTNTRLDLDYTITKTSSGNEYVACSSMAAGRYYTNLTLTTITGTGTLVLNTVDNIVSGTRLYVGPSSNTSYLNAYEEVMATSVSGNTVSISYPNNSNIPLSSYFNSGDAVTYLGDFYLFSDIGYGNSSSKGAMLTIDNYTGATLATHSSALYNNVYAANYGIPFYNTVSIVKGSELLYIDINDYSIVKSSRLNVTRPFSTTLLEVYAIASTLSNIYRLQLGKITRAGTGDYAELTWATYNYHEDIVARYSDSITLWTDPISIIGNQETITIIAHVRDQYGIALSGKTVKFDKVYGDIIGVWGDINREAVTDINGLAKITYTSGWYDPSVISNINEDIKISAKTDGSNALSGSIWVWTTMIFRLNAKFILGPSTTPNFGANIITQKNNTFNSTNTFTQKTPAFVSDFELKAYSYFRMPGGHVWWQDLNIGAAIVQQWKKFDSTLTIPQKQILQSSSAVVQTDKNKGSFPVSQTYISRHLPVGSNQDNVNIAQFKFIIDAVPTPFSEKNNVNATIWLKLAPYGFDLDASTLIFKVREVSYFEDTGFIDYVGTDNLEVIEFDAGGGLIGLELLYTPTEYFHNSAIVYVYLEVYDNGIPPNRIEFDYWFTIIPDYKAPYIENEVPARGQRDVPIDTDISFDILDTEVGVNIDTLEFYIDNRIKNFEYEILDHGYRVTFRNLDGFYYTQPVEISIKVSDSSDQSNVLYDMWNFYCEGSEPPFIDPESFYPFICKRGAETRTTGEYFSVYDIGTGISSIELLVDGVPRDIKLVPVIRRIS